MAEIVLDEVDKLYPGSGATPTLPTTFDGDNAVFA